MNTIARLSLLWVVSLSLLFSPSDVFPETKPDPHGKGGMCQYCHTSKVSESAEGGFRKEAVEATCLECHGKKGSNLKEYLQRMLPDVKMKEKLVTYFGNHPDFSCHSCHNAMSPRKSPGKELLFRNPHIQLNKDGEIIEKACLFCHTELPDYKNPSVRNTQMRFDTSYLCSLCHVMSTEKIGLGFGKRMTQSMMRTKRQFERQHDVSLPLGRNNMVVCASCHDPHQPGVVLRKGGDDIPHERRLVIEDTWLMCTACHSGTYQ